MLLNTRHLARLGVPLTAAFASLSSAFADADTPTTDPSSLAEISIEQLMELEIVPIHAASKYEQLVTQAPSSISIVTADEISKSGHRTLDEVLRSVRGLFVSTDRNYAYLGIRGFQRAGDYTSRVLILVDGHRINDNVGDAGMLDRSWMTDVELIERVEIIRGPASALYGSSAFFGVVNVVTKRGRHIGGFELEAGVGSLDTYSGRVTYGSAHPSGFDWLMSVSQYDSGGAKRLYYPEFDQRISTASAAANDGIAEDLDGERASKLFTSLHYGGLDASFYYSQRDKSVPTAPFGTIFNDPDAHTVDERAYADVKYEIAWSDTLQLAARGYYDYYTYRSFLPYALAAPVAPLERVLARYDIVGEWLGVEAQITARIADRHTIVAGGEYRKNLRQNQWAYYDFEPGEYETFDLHSSHAYGVFLQSETKLRSDLSLMLGLRVDEDSTLARTSITPRGALIYSPTEVSAVKLLYGEAFRAPNAYERISEHEHGGHSEDRLRPETIDTYEIVYERYFGRKYRLSLSAYHYAVKGLITAQDYESGSVQRFANAEDIRAHGLEAELTGAFASGLHVRGSYALQRASAGSTNSELSSSPRHLAKLNLTLPLRRQTLFPSLELQYRSASLTLAGTRARDFLLTNAQLTMLPFGPSLEFSLGVDNLLDVDAEHPASREHLQTTIEQNGRTFEGRWLVRF